MEVLVPLYLDHFFLACIMHVMIMETREKTSYLLTIILKYLTF